MLLILVQPTLGMIVLHCLESCMTKQILGGSYEQEEIFKVLGGCHTQEEDDYGLMRPMVVQDPRTPLTD